MNYIATLFLILTIRPALSETPLETAALAVPTLIESIQNLGGMEICISDHTNVNSENNLCKLGKNSTREERNRSIQHLCNNSRAQKNTKTFKETSDKIFDEIYKNINNPKHDIEEAINFLNSSPDASAAFSPKDESKKKREYEISFADYQTMHKILNTIKLSPQVNPDFLESVESCREYVHDMASALGSYQCWSTRYTSDTGMLPPSVHDSRYMDEIDKECSEEEKGLSRYRSRSFNCTYSDPARNAEIKYEGCMRRSTSSSFSYTSRDYLMCTSRPRSTPEILEKCRRNVERAREDDRLRHEKIIKEKCKAVKEQTLSKCQQEIRQIKEEEEAARTAYQACRSKKRKEISERIAQQKESRKREEEKRIRDENLECKRKIINDLLCSSKDIDPIPSCQGVSKKKETRESQQAAEIKRCSRLALTSMYKLSKKNFSLNEGDTPEQKVQSCMQRQNLSESTCGALEQKMQESNTRITELYTEDRMQKARKIFTSTKKKYLEMLESWKNDGKISDEKFDTLVVRLEKTTLEVPKDESELNGFFSGKATCRCHPEEGHQSDSKKCKKNTVTLGPQLILALEKGAAEKAVAMIMAHEIGHSLTPDMTETEDIFNNAYQCLSQKVSSDQYIHSDPLDKRRFAKETIADWLSSELIAYETSVDTDARESVRFTLETKFCSILSTREVQSIPCRYSDGKFLLPKEMTEECLEENNYSTYPTYPERLSIFTENPNLRSSLGCQGSGKKEFKESACEI